MRSGAWCLAFGDQDTSNARDPTDLARRSSHCKGTLAGSSLGNRWGTYFPLSEAMRGFSGLSDFFLRKAFKFALKRNLGKYLASELDPNQLDVQLGQGTIELRQLLLNGNELNAQLVSQLHRQCHYSSTICPVCGSLMLSDESTAQTVSLQQHYMSCV